MSRTTEEAMVDLAEMVDAPDIVGVYIERRHNRIEMTVSTHETHFHVDAHTLIEAVMRAKKRRQESAKAG